MDRTECLAENQGGRKKFLISTTPANNGVSCLVSLMISKLRNAPLSYLSLLKPVGRPNLTVRLVFNVRSVTQEPRLH